MGTVLSAGLWSIECNESHLPDIIDPATQHMPLIAGHDRCNKSTISLFSVQANPTGKNSLILYSVADLKWVSLSLRRVGYEVGYEVD